MVIAILGEWARGCFLWKVLHLQGGLMQSGATI